MENLGKIQDSFNNLESIGDCSLREMIDNESEEATTGSSHTDLNNSKSKAIQDTGSGSQALRRTSDEISAQANQLKLSALQLDRGASEEKADARLFIQPDLHPREKSRPPYRPNPQNLYQFEVNARPRPRQIVDNSIDNYNQYINLIRPLYLRPNLSASTASFKSENQNNQNAQNDFRRGSAESVHSLSSNYTRTINGNTSNRQGFENDNPKIIDDCIQEIQDFRPRNNYSTSAMNMGRKGSVASFQSTSSNYMRPMNFQNQRTRSTEISSTNYGNISDRRMSEYDTRTRQGTQNFQNYDQASYHRANPSFRSQPPQARMEINVPPRPTSVFDDSTSVSSNMTASTRISTVLPHENLEAYRQVIKKCNDPVQQFEFAKQLIQVSEEMRKNPQGIDPAKVRKNRDILHSEAVKWIKKAATSIHNGKSGYPDALFFLADCYGNATLGLTIDHNRAFGYYAQGAKQDHPSSIYRTGVCYEIGAGPKRDQIRAIQYYKKAAALGDTAAMYKMGTILLHGTLNQTRNPREGVVYLKRAANQSDDTAPYALHELAGLYETLDLDPAIGVDPSYAFELYLKSAQLGYASSQYKLGLVYEYGHLGLRVDPARSIGWYTKAAQQGDPGSELALSGWYLTGFEQLLAKNDKEAYLWARKAGDKGLAKAEYAVGYFLELGIGCTADLAEARRWYVRSASQNNARAIARLKGVSVEAPKLTQWRSDKEASKGDCSLM